MRTMGKQGLPCITDSFTERTKREIKAWDLEGKTPWRTTLCIGNGYKINTQGQVIWHKDIQLKPIFRKWKRSPFVIIKIKRKYSDGKPTTKDKEERIDNLMEKYFWPHIEWYSEKILHQDKEYIVVPKDGNWKDMSLGNLEYVVKKEYNLNWTTKALLLHLIPFFNSKSEEELAKLLWTTRWWVNRVKSELKEKGKIWDETLNKLIISRSTYQIHIALLACKWLKSNLDLVRELRPDPDLRDKKERDSLADKVSRVRKKLFDKWFIEKYNTYQKEVNIWDVREELEKTLVANKAMEKWKRKTHAEIAEAFGLWKEQVDNFSRQITKKENMKIEELELVE
jgi:hypothetical protein